MRFLLLAANFFLIALAVLGVGFFGLGSLEAFEDADTPGMYFASLLMLALGCLIAAAAITYLPLS